MIERHYVGTDCMGRQCEHTQTVTVEDNAPPVFTSGTSPQEASCEMDIDFQNTYAYEACSEPMELIVGEESILPGSCAGNYTRIRYVTATDACGNSTTVEQTITVTDTEPPLWTELLLNKLYQVLYKQRTLVSLQVKTFVVMLHLMYSLKLVLGYAL